LYIFIFEEKGDDWEDKRLGEVCNIIGGGTPSKNSKKQLQKHLY
jgi:hypothetical protein